MRKPNTFSTARRVATPTMELTSVYKNGRDYLILPDGVGIPFKMFGMHNSGPSCVLTPGGKAGIAAETSKAKKLAEQGFRVLVHDRRNTCAADIGFGNGSKTELEMQVEDTLMIIKHLSLTPCVFIGESSGGRMSLLCALKEPSAVRALCLRNMTGGKVAADVLSEAYHHQFMGPCKRGGMAEVSQAGFFQEMAKHNPDSRKQLLGTDPLVFKKVQQTSGDFLKNTFHLPVIGMSEAQLRVLSGSIPAQVFWSHFEDDKMHTRPVMEKLAELMQAGPLIIPKGGEDELVAEMAKFMRALPSLDS